MQEKLINLLHEGKINEFQYKTYLLYHTYEPGIWYLKYMSESVLMEEPPVLDGVHFAWTDGRRSHIRDIKMIINLINKLLRE